jgi:Spy/CpxP family protein refolding chaperone
MNLKAERRQMMTYGKKRFGILIGVFLITSVFTVNSAIGYGPGGKFGGFGGGSILGQLQKLDLTDAQKKTVAATLNTYVSQLQTDVQALATAREALIADTLQGNSTATDLTNLDTAETALANLQATIWLAIRADLAGSTQLTTLNEIAADLGTNHGRFGRHGFGLLRKLDLTKDQKTEIAGIFSSNKSALQTAKTNLASAKVKLIQDILEGNSITTDLTNLQSAVSSLAGLQATIWTEIRGDLKASQLTSLDGIAAKIQSGSFATAAIQKSFSQLEKWIAKY